MAQVANLQALIETWAAMYVDLHRSVDCKPKFHMFAIHVVEDMIRIGKALSCFTAERKHRLTKRAAVYVFRHIDNTVTKDLLNRHCELMADRGTNLFKKMYMVKSQQLCVAGMDLLQSKAVVLPCGSISVTDIIWTTDNIVGKVVKFWSQPGHDRIVAQIDEFSMIDDHWQTMEHN